MCAWILWCPVWPCMCCMQHLSPCMCAWILWCPVWPCMCAGTAVPELLDVSREMLLCMQV
jgi:hypothetical protein